MECNNIFIWLSIITFHSNHGMKTPFYQWIPMKTFVFVDEIDFALEHYLLIWKICVNKRSVEIKSLQITRLQTKLMFKRGGLFQFLPSEYFALLTLKLNPTVYDCRDLFPLSDAKFECNVTASFANSNFNEIQMLIQMTHLRIQKFSRYGASG